MNRSRWAHIVELLAQLVTSKIVNCRGDRSLPVVGVVQVDQRGPGAGMAHACHEFAQACSGGRGQDVAGMAQVVDVDLGQACLGECWQPHPAAEVAAP